MRLPFSLSAVVLLVAFSVLPSIALAEAEIDWFPSDETTFPKSISADGSTVAGHPAFRWKGDEIEWIRDEIGGSNGRYGVSADGSVVVGTTYEDYDRLLAFRWRRGVLSIISPDAEANDVSANGRVIVGNQYDSEGHNRKGVRWVPNRQEALPITDATSDFVVFTAEAISDDGRVIVGSGGAGFDADSGHNDWFGYYRWEKDHIERIELPPGLKASNLFGLVSISADGSTVVGWGTYTDRNQNSAWRWNGGVIEELTLPEGESTIANGVSGNGAVIVGQYWVPEENSSRAFIWDVAHGTRDLTTLVRDAHGVDLDGHKLSYAMDISNNGRMLVGLASPLDDPFDAGTTWRLRLPPACSDDIDNDGDGLTDYPEDDGCMSPEAGREDFGTRRWNHMSRPNSR